MELIDRTKLSVSSIDTTDLPEDEGLMVYLADDVDNAEVIPAITIDELEKMRNEMESRLYKGVESTAFTWQNLGVNMCLEIIDKYIEKAKGAE